MSHSPSSDQERNSSWPEGRPSPPKSLPREPAQPGTTVRTHMIESATYKHKLERFLQSTQAASQALRVTETSLTKEVRAMEAVQLIAKTASVQMLPMSEHQVLRKCGPPQKQPQCACGTQLPALEGNTSLMHGLSTTSEVPSRCQCSASSHTHKNYTHASKFANSTGRRQTTMGQHIHLHTE